MILPFRKLPEADVIFVGPASHYVVLFKDEDFMVLRVEDGSMMEKHGVIDAENTKPEKPGDEDLEQHLTKRAAAKLEKKEEKGRPVEPRDAE